MMCFHLNLVVILSLVSFPLASASLHHSCALPMISPENAVQVDPSVVNAAVFEQLIDHNNPTLGTFQQRYWYSTEFWGGPGSPVVLYNVGESAVVGTNVDFRGYLGNITLVGQYAQALNGASVLVEHRYWGESSPYTNLTADNLQYLTVPQSIQDMTYFAKNVNLPFDLSGLSNSDTAPWVLIGSSYSGNLAAWTALTEPGVFWAYHASSAPVQSIEDFWQYFYPIQQGMPVNCSISIESIIAQVDAILMTGTDVQKQALKSIFGLGLVTHDDDFASALIDPLELWQQSINTFLPFCDALEGGQSGQPSGMISLSVNVTVSNYGRYVNSHFGCTSADCYDTYNSASPEYKDTTIDTSASGGRQWQWMLCHEGFKWWQTGAPVGQETIVSRLVTVEYLERECELYFPGVQFNRTAEQQNLEYMGWDIMNTSRLMLSNGEFDPWRSASVSSEFRPGGPLLSTSQMPIFIVPNASHAQDIYTNNPTSDIQSIRLEEIAQMESWVNEYYQQSSDISSTSAAFSLSSTDVPISASTTSTFLASAEPTSSSNITTASISLSQLSIPTSLPTSIYRTIWSISSVDRSPSPSFITIASPTQTASTESTTEIYSNTSCSTQWPPCQRAVVNETAPLLTATRLVSTPEAALI